MDLGIKDKVVLVTASSKGIGREAARAFAEEGCRVAVCARDKKALIQTAEDLKNQYGVETFWCVCDIAKEKEIERTVKEVNNYFGSIDILVNNCGGPVPGLLRDITEENWESAYMQVLMSVVRFSNLVIPEMIKKEWGRIINITSISVKQPVENLLLSNTFRSGVTAFAKTISNEFAKFNITVNNIAPGYTLTNRMYELAVHRAKQQKMSHEEVLADYAKQIPMGRLAMPEEIAAAVVFLGSAHAGYITGNTITVDGGFTKSLF